MGLLVSVDNGGTLTDFCAFDGARTYIAKTLTTPHDLTECLIDGLRALSREIYGVDAIERIVPVIDHVRYSTTQGTNAIVQRRGPRLGLLAEDGALPDRIRAHATDLFDQLVGERVAITAGRSDAQIVRTVSDLVARGANRIVVVADAARERALKAAIHDAFPRHLLGAVPLLFSTDLTAVEAADRRAWSALLNAFLHPSMEQFLYNAESRLRRHRLRNPLLVFRNDGNSTRVAKTVALSTYSSGPRGGLEGMAVLASDHGFERLVSIDIGGTTTDIARRGRDEAMRSTFGSVEGAPIAFPLADVRSIGVGGGSVLRVADGHISVGPDSVGAAPGPACFGRGGTLATMTDVMLAAGLFDPASFFSGKLALDPVRAQDAVDAHIARPLGLDRAAAIEAAIDAYDARITAELGDGVAGACLVAFGGAGPMSACGIAERAAITTVIIPSQAAVFSAFGIGFSNIQHAYAAPFEGKRALVEAELLAQAARGMTAEGFALDECALKWSLLVEEGDGARRLPADAALPLGTRATLSLEVERPIARPVRPMSAPASASLVMARERRAAFGDMPVHRLRELAPGDSGLGPCLVEDPYFTSWVRPGWRFFVTAAGDLLLTRDAVPA